MELIGATMPDYDLIASARTCETVGPGPRAQRVRAAVDDRRMPHRATHLCVKVRRSR